MADTLGEDLVGKEIQINTIVNEKRVFQVMHDKKLKLLEYQKDNWWEKYRNSNS